MAEGGSGTAPTKVFETPVPRPTTARRAGVAEELPETQTVFDETKFVPKPPDCTIAVNSTTKRIQRASMRFFVVSGVSFIEAFYFRTSDWKLVVTCGVVAVIFGILGALVYQLKKGAVLAAMALFLAETLQLLVHGWNTTMLTVIFAVFVHSAIIYRLYLTYGMMCDLETAKI
jgi:hypothetical protein